MLWLTIYDTKTTGYYAGLIEAGSYTDTPMALCIPDPKEEPVYTCHPESGMGWQDVQAAPDGTEYILRLGNYELRIRNGKKELKIEN